MSRGWFDEDKGKISDRGAVAGFALLDRNLLV